MQRRDSSEPECGENCPFCSGSKRTGESCRQPDHIRIAGLTVGSQSRPGVTGGYAEFEALQQRCSNDVKNVPALAHADSADSPPLLEVVRAWRAVMTLCTAHSMRPSGPQVSRFEYRPAEFGDAHPESSLSRDRITDCADPAHALPLPNTSGAYCGVVTSCATNAVRPVFTKPGRLSNRAAKFSNTSPESRIGRGGITARTSRADTDSATDITWARRTVMTRCAANPVSLPNPKPYRLGNCSAEFGDAHPESRFSGHLAPDVIFSHSRGPFPRSGTRSTVLVTPPGPATSIVTLAAKNGGGFRGLD